MSYNSIFEGMFGLLAAETTLVPTILGPVTNQNLRLYRAFPQWEQYLTTYEPIAPAEGWLVVEEPAPGLRFGQSQYTSDHEVIDMTMHLFATTYAVAHDALDVLDQLFHWTVMQQRDVVWGEWILLFTRRVQNAEKYEQQTKLYQKDFMYRQELVRTEQLFP